MYQIRSVCTDTKKGAQTRVGLVNAKYSLGVYGVSNIRTECRFRCIKMHMEKKDKVQYFCEQKYSVHSGTPKHFGLIRKISASGDELRLL